MGPERQPMECKHRTGRKEVEHGTWKLQDSFMKKKYERPKVCDYMSLQLREIIWARNTSGSILSAIEAIEEEIAWKMQTAFVSAALLLKTDVDSK